MTKLLIKKPLNLLQLFQSVTLQEWITASVIATGLGVSYLFWAYLYELSKPLLKPLGLEYITSGLWIIASIFVSNLIRKPGIALFTSLVAALVESMVTQWGFSALIYGFIQGLSAEIIFVLFLYRNWSLGVLCLAAATAAFFSYSYDYLIYDYNQLLLEITILQLASFIISAITLGAVFSMYLSKRLLKTGLLDSFLIVQQQIK